MADPLFDLDVEHRAASSRFLELLRRDEPGRHGRVHVDAAALRQAALPARSTRSTRSRRSTSTASRSTRPSSSTSSTHERLRAPARRRCGSRTCSGPASACATTSRASSRSSCGARCSDETITVFGDGAQERDCLYVDDVVECLLLAALAPDAPGEVFNVGNDEHLSLRAIAEAIVAAAGSGRVEHVPWPPDRDAIDIGSYFGDSSKAKRMLGWEPRTRVRRRHRAARSRSTGAPSRGTCDDDAVAARPGRRPRPRARRALEPELSARRRRVSCAPGGTSSGPRPRRSRPSSPRSCGRRHAVGGRVGHRGAAARAASRSASVPGDEVIVPGVHRGADRGGGVRGGRGARCSSTSTATPRRIDPDAAACGASRERTRAVDPGAPLRPAGGAPRPRRPGARGRRAGARRARPAAPSRPRRRTASTRRRTSAGSATAARSSPTTTTSRRTSALLRGARPHATDYDARRRVRQLAAVRDRGRGAAASGCAGSPRQNARRRRDRAARTARRRPDCAGRRPHERHVYHLCVARVADRDDVPGRGCRSTPACTTRVRSPSSPPTGSSCGRRAPKPRRGRPSAYRYRASPR